MTAPPENATGAAVDAATPAKTIAVENLDQSILAALGEVDNTTSTAVRRPPRPPMPTVNLDGIPAALKALALWCEWDWKRERNNDGGWKWTKNPVRRDAGLGPILRRELKSGTGTVQGFIGFVLDGTLEIGGARLFAFDLDGCRDPETGIVHEWAVDFIARCGNTYTEVTPSGCGLRVWLLVRRTPEAWKPRQQFTHHFFPINPGPVIAAAKGKKVECEVFGGGTGPGSEQFVTVTGQRLDGTSSEIETIDDLYWWPEIFGRPAEKAGEGGRYASETEIKPSGPVPTTDEIRDGIRKQHPKAEALLTKDLPAWFGRKDYKPKDTSNSGPALVLSQLALIAANGHVDAAAKFIYRETPWGNADPDNSSQRYSLTWWQQDVRRAWDKDLVLAWRRRNGAHRMVPLDAVDEIDEIDTAAAEEADTSAPAPAASKEAAPDAADVTVEVAAPAPSAPSGAVAPTAASPAAAASVAASSSTPPILIDPEEQFAALSRSNGDGILVPRFVARGRISTFTGPPKDGKSLFLQAALSGWALDEPRELPGFGKPPAPLRVLYCSENSPDDDAVSLHAFDHGPTTRGGMFRLLNRAAMPQFATFEDFLAWLAVIVKDNHFDVVVIDTLDAWIPDLEDSNSAAQVAARFSLLRQILAVGCNVSVVAVLHAKKGSEVLSFDGILGSVKYRASADFNLVMARVAPDDKDDRRVVIRREGRDPWGMIRIVCGRLPECAGPTVLDRRYDTANRFCYRLKGSFVIEDGEERARLEYVKEDVPEQFLGTGGGGRTLSVEGLKKLDELVLLEAVRLHADEEGPEPVSSRKLAKDGFLSRAAARLGAAVPSSYQPPGDRKVRTVEARLVEDGRLIAHDGGGVKIGTEPGDSVFQPLGEGVE